MNELIDVALGKRSADLVLKNGFILDVYTQSFKKGNLAIHQGKIVGIGDYRGHEEIDCTDRYLVPGLIDGHMHLESTLLLPGEYARMMLPHGITTVIADPHEIANVSGIEGVRFIMDSAKDLPLDFYFMLPSCIPSSPLEEPGSPFGLEEFQALKDEAQILGLGEMMDYPGLLKNDPLVLNKLALFQDEVVDGHAPGLQGKELIAYASQGITTDHECTTAEEMKERIALGMYVQIREGSSARDADSLLPAVDDANHHRIFFCTDDKHPTDLLREGSINYVVAKAIKSGISPARAYTMASLHAAQAYRLHDRGALTPGKRADLLVLKDLEKVEIQDVYTAGVPRVHEGKLQDFPILRPNFPNRVHIHPLEPHDLAYPNGHAIKVLPGSLLTALVKRKNDHSKLLLVERHHGKPMHAVAAIQGFDITNGAMATTISHDAHNAICLGDNDEDMLLAVNRLEELGGGIVLISSGEVLGELELPVSGLLSDQPYEAVVEKLSVLEELAHEQLNVPRELNPFVTLSFLALPVIPEVKLTLHGLYDVSKDCLLKED